MKGRSLQKSPPERWFGTNKNHPFPPALNSIGSIPLRPKTSVHLIYDLSGQHHQSQTWLKDNNIYSLVIWRSHRACPFVVDLPLIHGEFRYLGLLRVHVIDVEIHSFNTFHPQEIPPARQQDPYSLSYPTSPERQAMTDSDKAAEGTPWTPWCWYMGQGFLMDITRVIPLITIITYYNWNCPPGIFTYRFG